MANIPSFSACNAGFTTNVRQCGTVTQCDAKPILLDELTTSYTRSGDYKIMEALFMHDLEIKSCGSKEGTLYDFLMASKVNLSKKVQTDIINSGLVNVRPFVLARQTNPINKQFWTVSGGTASGETNWRVDLTSNGGMPLDVRWFNVGDSVFIDGVTGGGDSTKTAWKVVSRSIVSTVIRVVLSPQNSASCLSEDRLESPVTGLLVRGINNVSDYENWCEQSPGVLNWKNVPFWVQTSRDAFCKDELYDKWRSLLLEGNALYREFGDLDQIELNRQQGDDFKQRWTNAFLFNKPLDNQTVNTYDQLESIESYSSNGLGIGVRCIGKRANAVGVYEQLACCGRVYDAQGAALNILSLIDSLYSIWRTRKANAADSSSIDLFTDRVTADKINTAMLNYYKSKAGSADFALQYQVNQAQPKSANFGFSFRSYPLFEVPISINVVTHDYFDDMLAASVSAGMTNTGRVLWVLDFATIYPGILQSNRVVNKTGDLKALAAVDSAFGCVMKVPSKEQTLSSVTWTAIVECPQASMIIENFSDAVPSISSEGAPDYPPTTTTTTTTTTAP